MRSAGVALVILGALMGLTAMTGPLRLGGPALSTHAISKAAAGVLISILLIVLGQYVIRRNPRI